MDEGTWLHVAVGVDMAVGAPPCYTSSDIVAVIPEVDGEDRLRLSEGADLTVHVLALVGPGDKLRRGVHADRHVGEEPGELRTLLDEEVDVALASDDLRVRRGVTAGGTKQDATLA